MPPRNNYTSNVFLNFPFDEGYVQMQRALVFAIYDCGFIPRCALEESNSVTVRFEKIQRLIADSKFAIHDISRTEPDVKTGLPRFNMPLELGVFIGAKRFGGDKHQRKNCLVLDCEKYRYQKFISDISGHDIEGHDSDPEKLITVVRNWLNAASERKTIPGGREIIKRYHEFQKVLPDMCAKVPIDLDELTYNDYSGFVSEWLKLNRTAVSVASTAAAAVAPAAANPATI